MDTDLTGNTEQLESKWVLVRDALSAHCQWGICLSWTEQIFRENCLKNIQSYYSFFFFFWYCGVQLLSLFFKKIFIFGSSGSSLPCAGFSLVLANGGYSPLQCSGFSLQWLLLLKLPGSRMQAQQLRRTGLVAPRHVESSLTRDRTCVPCIGRWILYHWTTSEVSNYSYREIHIEYIKRKESWKPFWIILPPPKNCFCCFSLSPGWWLV